MTNRALLGVDGNCGFAVIGQNIQEGEVEFEVIDTSEPRWTSAWHVASNLAINKSYQRLKKRLGLEHLSYELDPSHPKYC